MAGLYSHAALIACSLFGLVSTSFATDLPKNVPASFDVAGRSVLIQVHALGGQIYECKTADDGGMEWRFREPVATLIVDGKTVGRHFAGPNWELADGSAVTGKLAAAEPGAAAGDVPLLKLNVVAHRGSGGLTGATLVLRLNTAGGNLKGTCPSAGALKVEPYEADYFFLR